MHEGFIGNKLNGNFATFLYNVMKIMSYIEIYTIYELYSSILYDMFTRIIYYKSY
jgi:hypothetical protein